MADKVTERSVPKNSIDKVNKPYKVFVVSPIGSPGSEPHKKAHYALTYIIRKALCEPDWHVERADEGDSPDSIGQHVVKKIHEADLVVADLTDLNPNVFYELAIAHGWHKPVIHMMQSGQRPPFDVADMRTIFYDLTDAKSVDEAIDSVIRSANLVITNEAPQATPLTQFAAFNHALSDPNPETAQALLFEDISQRLSRIERNVMREPLATNTAKTNNRDPWSPPRLERVEAFQEAAERYAILYPSGEPGPGEPIAQYFELISDLTALWGSFDRRGQKMVLDYLQSRGTKLPAPLQMLT